MRTLTDLREALAACEQPAPALEHFLREIPGAELSFQTTTTTASSVLTLTTRPSLHARRRTTLWLTAAAIAVITAVALALALPRSSSPNSVATPAPSPTSTAQASALTLPFSLDQSAGVEVIGYGWMPGLGMFSATLANATTRVTLRIDDPAAAGRAAPARPSTPLDSSIQAMESKAAAAASSAAAGRAAITPASSEPVEINGTDATLTKTPIVDGHEVSAPPPSTWDGKYEYALSWRAADGRTLTIMGGAIALTQDEVLKVARAIHLDTGADPVAPMRSAFSVSPPPIGQYLFTVDASYPTTTTQSVWGAPHYKWISDVTYSPNPNVGTDGSVQIRAYGMDAGIVPKMEGKDVTNVSVDGKPARFDGQTLTVDMGADVYLDVSVGGFAESGGVIVPDTPVDQLVAIAKTVTLAPDPSDTSTWFDAAKAIPTGS